MDNESLITWTNRVFSLIKEQTGTGNLAYQVPEETPTPADENETKKKIYCQLVHAVDPTDFLDLMHQYASRASQTLDDEKKWLDQKKPESSFFTFDAALQFVETDTSSYKEQEKMEQWENEHLYVQKVVLPEGSDVCFFGDYHGSIHSCIRNLWRLVASGHLDTDFRIIKDNFYIVGLGDYVDRGWFSLEVVYTLLLLKLAPGNWDKVFLLKGNHETINQSAWKNSQYSCNLFQELTMKFGTEIPGYIFAFGRKMRTIMLNGEEKSLSSVLLLYTLKWYTFLPEALFIGNGNNEYIQCSHGGIEQSYDYAILTHNQEKNFQKLDGLYNPYPGENQNCTDQKWESSTGLNWSDFIQTTQPSPYETNRKREVPKSSRGCGIAPDVQWTTTYLNKHPYLKGFFRGHQDLFFGLKMLFKPEAYPTKEDFIKHVEQVEKRVHLNQALVGLLHARGECARLEKNKDMSYERRYSRLNKKEQRKHYGKLEQEAYDKAYTAAKERYTNFYALAEKLATYNYENGPFHWKLVVSKEDQNNTQGFLINNYVPIFTFSSAPFGRGLDGNLFPFDCYGILTITSNYETWRLKVYENILSADRDNKYCSIKFTPTSTHLTDYLKLTWTKKPKNACCPNKDKS